MKINKRVDLRTIFCFEDIRTVSNDWVVRYANRYFQLIRQKGVEVRSKMKVTVAEWLDGSIHILYKNKELLYEELSLKAFKKKHGWVNSWLITSLRTFRGDISKVV